MVAKIEDIPDEQKDWHPRSNGLVLDLVHPSLYPLVYGRTHEIDPDLPEKLQAIIPALFLDRCSDWSISRQFAWIPTDFRISEDGTTAEALSYINNAQQYPELYPIVESLVARFSNMFDEVLIDIPHNLGYYGDKHGDRYHRISMNACYTIDRTELGSSPIPRWDDDRSTRESYDDYRQRRKEFIVPPTIPEGGPDSDRLSKLRDQVYSTKGEVVQVIVKLANIHLVSWFTLRAERPRLTILQTPEKPEYPGGSWHIEGMANEAIVASGIYYYDSENVSESRLAFRQAVSGLEIAYERSDDDGTRATFGMDR